MEPESKDYGRLLWVMALATMIAGGLTVLAERSFSSPPQLGADAWLQPAVEPIYVELRVPGSEAAVYRLPPGATVATLLAAVGRAHLSTREDGRPLRPGESVQVHDDGTVSFGIMSGAHLIALGLRIPLNRATVDDLMALPGVGERLAIKIVNHRDQNGGFGSYDDLLGVPGLGPGVLETLKRHTAL